MSMKYKGQEIELNNGGKFEADDIDEAFDTIEEAKAAIDEFVKARDATPRTPVLIWKGGRWHAEWSNGYIQAKAGKGDSYKVWLSWKDERGNNQRETRQYHEVFLDIPENRKKLDEYLAKMKKITELESEADEFMKTIATLPKPAK